MPLTNFPNGVASFGVPLIGSGPILTTGNVFFVDSGSSNAADDPAHGADSNKPFATIDYAIGQCTASNDDHVIVMPGHSETITTDGGIAMDVAGVSIIGIGRGTLRPVIILDAAAAAVTVSAANCTMQNMELRASFADITNAIDITATHCHLLDLEFTQEAVTLNFLDMIAASSTTDNNADGLTIIGCRATTFDGAALGFLTVAADLDRLKFINNFYSSTSSTTTSMIVCASGKDLTDCEILCNRMAAAGKTAGDILVDNDTTSNTGICAYNVARHGDTAAEVLVDLSGAGVFENYGTAANDASGYLLPVADS